MKYIKFRAWDTESGKMVDLIDIEEQRVFSKRLLHPEQYVPMILIWGCVKGPVYEGDLVTFDVCQGSKENEPEIRNQRGVVKFDPIDGASYGVWHAGCCKNVKVIGNIYENRDLADRLKLGIAGEI